MTLIFLSFLLFCLYGHGLEEQLWSFCVRIGLLLDIDAKNVLQNPPIEWTNSF